MTESIRGTIKPVTDKLAAAIVSAAREHGTPNSFEPGFLYRYQRGPSPLLAGSVAVREFSELLKAVQALEPTLTLAYERFESGPRRFLGRFVVDSAPTRRSRPSP